MIRKLLVGLGRRPPFNVVVPPLALAQRVLRRRWWRESELEAGPVRQPAAGDRQSLDDGVGDALTRRYEIDLTDAERDPTDVLEEFRRHPDRFAPTDYAAFGHGPLTSGDEFEIRLAGPWNGPVRVADVEPDRIRLVTLDGHMEAGRIDFIAVDDGARRLFRIESTARAGDVPFWLLHDVLPVGRWVQTDMWSRVLEKAATIGGVRPVPRVDVLTLRHDDED